MNAIFGATAYQKCIYYGIMKRINNYLMITLLLFVGLPQGAFAQAKTLSGKALFGNMRARQIGPAVMSGRVSSIDVVASDPRTMYVGAAGGGVWKSTSAGASFSPIFDDYPQSIGKITIDQQRPDTLWVGTGEPWPRNSVSVGNGIYRSVDAGQTWTFKGLKDSERIGDIIIHPENPDVVYVAVLGHLWNANEERGVYKTADGGATWEKIFYLDENTGCSDLDIDPENPAILYAAMWSFRRYPWFFDSGMKDHGGKSGLYKSTDGGKSWNPIHNGLPQETLGRLAIGVAPSNGNTIYLSVEVADDKKKGLYKSTDQGANWKMVNGDFNNKVRPFYFSNIIVDPKDENRVMKCGYNAIVSKDGGNTFRQIASGVHSDIHDIWIDPKNTNHVILGTDGGVYESYDGAFQFKMFMNLPISQFYHISVDDDEPFNVYGGLQDNGSWYAPSSKAGGITNADWKNSYGGDGFYSFRHPKKKNIVFSEAQGGQLVRYDTKSGRSKDIKPYPEANDPEFRFNWNAPIHISRKNPDRMYFASQFLFMSEDMGDSWKRISDDLTTNDPEKQQQAKSGGLSIDNSTAENHCTIYAVSESPVNDQVVWVGTDDGNLQVTTNGGESWTNVTPKDGLPPTTWVSFVEPSNHDENVAYITFDGHRTGDGTTYLFKTTDMGKTWENIAKENIEGYALSVREDLVNPNLLFLGTEWGLYISIDGGANWSQFTNNMPKVGVRDMVIHPREHALVMGTHGRGVIILDDLTALRQITAEVLAKPFHIFKVQPTVLKDPGSGGGWFGGAGNFVGPNPNTSAQIVYYMSRRHTFGTMNIEIYDQNDQLIRTLPAGKNAGINMVDLPTRIRKPKSAPTKNRMALFGSLLGLNLEAGDYKVKVIKGKKSYETTLSLVYDEDSPYSSEDRKVQYQTAKKLYDMSERLAYIYQSLDQITQQLSKGIEASDKVAQKFKEDYEAIQQLKSSLVALEGDFYVDEGEQIRERISDLFRQVSQYPGKPSESQLTRTAVLSKDMAEVDTQFTAIVKNQLPKINKALERASLSTIQLPSFEDFLSK
ncbi:MAG: WD40/YVTN/BNR-like repeat-containing protein [Flammeovirgaceae bacterium]